jgi:hypothetical protein
MFAAARTQSSSLMWSASIRRDLVAPCVRLTAALLKTNTVGSQASASPATMNVRREQVRRVVRAFSADYVAANQISVM